MKICEMQIKINKLREEYKMDFLELAKKRYSARKYLNKPIEPEKLKKVLETGRVAPTACNNQPQRILVVQSPEGLQKIGKCCRAYNSPVALIICADRNKAWMRAYDRKLSADIDASIVTDHMMLCAADCGLDSVWVCAFNPAAIRDEFDIPENLEPINILFIGYADGDPASPHRHDKLRLPLENTVFYESF